MPCSVHEQTKGAMIVFKIITNHQYRDLIYGYELSESERADFDYVEDIDSHSFFKYRGVVYDPGEFAPTPHNEPARQDLNVLSDWHGYQPDSFFSGIVIKYSDDYESVKVGLYLS
jgi:hypothetical protein